MKYINGILFITIAGSSFLSFSKSIAGELEDQFPAKEPLALERETFLEGSYRDSQKPKVENLKQDNKSKFVLVEHSEEANELKKNISEKDAESQNKSDFYRQDLSKVVEDKKEKNSSIYSNLSAHARKIVEEDLKAQDERFSKRLADRRARAIKKHSSPLDQDRQIPRSSDQDRQIPRSSDQDRQIPRSSDQDRQIPRSSDQDRQIPRSSDQDRQIPRSSDQDRQIPRSSDQDTKDKVKDILMRSIRRGLTKVYIPVRQDKKNMSS
ncbi:hypothetical protein HE1_00406 [Holospora elegans E1]|uniref:Uncharacterized protein n=2 Tax=Holospora TaxID=44747 RepID=A0A023DYL7_9PROT|nr:hypothetical protein HE1_00406 [Holospora elegans E1]